MKIKTFLLFTVLAVVPAMAQIPVNCGDTLDTPGAVYVLTGNLTCPLAPAVHVVADNVTFDLQGFTLAKSGANAGAAIITAAGPSCVITNGVTIQNGTITGFGVAISLCVPTTSVPSASTHANINHMTLTGNGTGIALFNADDNNIHQNIVDGNVLSVGGTPGTGIALVHSSGNFVHQNEVKGNLVNGIVLIQSSNNTLRQNDIGNNNANGIVVGLGSLGNLFKQNQATGDGAFDAYEVNAACGTNVWQMNTFNKTNQACIQ